jgi:hypothetical protein
MVVKNATQWINPSGTGYILNLGNLNIVTNSGKTLITNTLKYIVTNTVQSIGKYATAWTGSGV